MWEIVTVLVLGRILLINIRATRLFVAQCDSGGAGNTELSHLSKMYLWVKKEQEEQKAILHLSATVIRISLRLAPERCLAGNAGQPRSSLS